MGSRLSPGPPSSYLWETPDSGATGTTPLIRLILNILWFIFGGWLSGLLWLLGGAVLAGVAATAATVRVGLCGERGAGGLRRGGGRASRGGREFRKAQ